MRGKEMGYRDSVFVRAKSVGTQFVCKTKNRRKHVRRRACPRLPKAQGMRVRRSASVGQKGEASCTSSLLLIVSSELRKKQMLFSANGVCFVQSRFQGSPRSFLLGRRRSRRVPRQDL